VPKPAKTHRQAKNRGVERILIKSQSALKTIYVTVSDRSRQPHPVADIEFYPDFRHQYQQSSIVVVKIGVIVPPDILFADTHAASTDF
jgi:hypothetical protein